MTMETKKNIFSASTFRRGLEHETLVPLRIGARWNVLREKKARTPYERVLGRDDVSRSVKAKLRIEHEKLNPLTQKCKIEKRLAALYAVRKQFTEPKL